MMNTYLIGYDLNRPGQNYDDLIEAIKNLNAGWWHCLDSTWIIKSSLSSVHIRDILMKHIDKNDVLLVIKLSNEVAWIGFNTECSNWLKNNL